MKDWKIKARAEGRICPECNRPVSRETWKDMQVKGKVRSCYTCRYVHWQIPIYNSCGSSEIDNEDREGLDRIRENS